MGNRVRFILAATLALCAVPAAAFAAERQAPPTLTLLNARSVAAVCPDTKPYADGLARGISERDAAAAAPVFDACARDAKRYGDDYRRVVASLAVGAAYLSRGLLTGDATMLQRAIDATARNRSYVAANDDTVRAWSIIPDRYDVRRHEEIISTDCLSDVSPNAAYINVAAHHGSTWINEPRTPEPCMYRNDGRSVGWNGNALSANPFPSRAEGPSRPNPAIETDERFPGVFRPQ